MDRLTHGETLQYWKDNAEEDYLKVPISVLKYIAILEEEVLNQVKNNGVLGDVKKRYNCLDPDQTGDCNDHYWEQCEQCKNNGS